MTLPDFFCNTKTTNGNSTNIQSVWVTFTVLILLLVTSVFATDSPIKCYKCTNIKDPSLCNTVTECAMDEVCHVDEIESIHNLTTYEMGCARKHPCVEVTRFRLENNSLFSSSTIVGKRLASGLKSCSVCCGDSLCNNIGCFTLTKHLRELWKAGLLDLATMSIKQ